MAFFDEVHATKKQRLGTRKRHFDGTEYIYLTGVGSTAVGDVVAFDELHVTTRMLQATIGRVAVAKAAVDATTKYGWYQIYGLATAVKVASGFAADQAGTFGTSSAGTVDDSGAGGEEVIIGMIGRSAISSGTASFELNYPVKLGYTFD